MALYQISHVHLYYLYVSNDIIENYSKYNLKNLNILRFDVSEKQLYDMRKKQNEDVNNNIINLIENRKLNNLSKIAFISRDFHERRPSGQLTIKFFKLMKELYPDLRIYFYMYLSSPISDYFKTLATVVANEDLDLLKEQVINDEIDILIDMQGHMHSNFNNLFKYRLAPIQLHWLGYPGTLGIKNIDYLVADKTIVPKKSQQYYVEKMAYMPHCYQCNNDDLLVTKSNLKRSDFNIPDDAFVFCHFNHEYKLDRKTWFVWMNIMKRVPNSVIVFTTFTTAFSKILFHDASINGIDKERLIYLEYETDREKHFNRINLCDLGLDCYRLNGHTSSSDLIASGIPFVSYTSETYHNRVSKTILKSIDLEELVCYSFDEYADLAVRLATDKLYYDSIKQKVIENRTKYLFNTKLYVENFVEMLHTIWEDNKQANVKPNTICDTNENSEENKDVIAEINKDYNLPMINLLFNDYDNETFIPKLSRLLNYICNQSYLNIRLIIIVNPYINSKNINILQKISYFHNVFYYDTIPHDLVNIINVDSNNYEIITNDLHYVSNYHKNYIDDIKPIVVNTISADLLDLKQLYNEKLDILKDLKIDSSLFLNLPHIYWINLERSSERREKITSLFEKHNLKNTRVDAFDYLNIDNFCANNTDEICQQKINMFKQRKNKMITEMKQNNPTTDLTLFDCMLETDVKKNINNVENTKSHKQKELSCLSSHLKAMKTFLETSNDKYCIIAEDDLSLEYTKYWDKTFWEYLESLPDDWECLQLTQIMTVHSIQHSNFIVNRINIIPYKKNFSWSTTAYLINRKGAQKLLDKIDIFDNKYYFKNLNESIADVYIYKHLNTYTIPLFTYMNEDDSTINNNDKHLKISKKLIDEIWVNYYEENN